MTPIDIAPRRVHLSRLLTIWRSAGWPCRDAIEIDLLGAGWITLQASESGHETLRLTDAGIRLLADGRQRNQRSLSPHDRLADRVARQLMDAGRVVWRELSLRSQAGLEPAGDDAPALPLVGKADNAGAMPGECDDPGPMRSESDNAGPMPGGGKAAWRIARPDVFSVRHTTVERYLHPMVHEVKVSRADLLSDLRHAAKRESYRWLSCETWYVFPVGVAQPQEIPEVFGVWLLDGAVDDGRLECVRPARHVPCKLPFAVWMALARATPAQGFEAMAQGLLGAEPTHDRAW